MDTKKTEDMKFAKKKKKMSGKSRTFMLINSYRSIVLYIQHIAFDSGCDLQLYQFPWVWQL